MLVSFIAGIVVICLGSCTVAVAVSYLELLYSKLGMKISRHSYFLMLTLIS